MKLPIWAWDHVDHKYAALPQHLIETFEDGTQGITLHPHGFSVGITTPWDVACKERQDAIKRFKTTFTRSHLSKRFDPEITSQRYVFRHQYKQSKHRHPYTFDEQTAVFGIQLGGVIAVSMGMITMGVVLALLKLGKII